MEKHSSGVRSGHKKRTSNKSPGYLNLSSATYSLSYLKPLTLIALSAETRYFCCKILLKNAEIEHSSTSRKIYCKVIMRPINLTM